MSLIQSREHIKKTIQQYRDFAAKEPDHPMTLANKHLLDFDYSETWGAAAVLSVAGFGWWTLNLSGDLSYPDTFEFSASGGPSWDISLFEASVFGYFMKDPSTLGSDMQFRMQGASIGEGVVSIDLYDSNWSQLASFFGASVGVSASSMSGEGTYKYEIGS